MPAGLPPPRHIIKPFLYYTEQHASFGHGPPVPPLVGRARYELYSVAPE